MLVLVLYIIVKQLLNHNLALIGLKNRHVHEHIVKGIVQSSFLPDTRLEF
jgi:hypothetical protein